MRYYISPNNSKFKKIASNNKKEDKKIKMYNILENKYNWFFNYCKESNWRGYTYDDAMYLYKTENISNLSLKK